MAAVALGACTPVNPPQPADAQGKPIALPGPYDRWLQITDISPTSASDGPTDVALQPTISITFNDYLQDDSFRSHSLAAMASGGVKAYGHADYVMTDKTIVWHPWSALEPGLVYDFTILDKLTSATGAPYLAPVTPPQFKASRDVEASAPVALPDATWSQIEPIFEQRCTSCHRDKQWKLNPLTYDSLVGEKSAETDLYLVRPGDAPDSYLMRKLLWDYPDIEFTPQPPPWSAGSEELPRDELRLVEGWIAHGARR